jgi:glycerate kinase
MNILIAPNSMKGSLSAFEFAEIIGKAFSDVSPSAFAIRKVPVADGGDHTSGVLISALRLEKHEATVSDPLGRDVKAEFGVANGVAVLEMANASGIKLLKKGELNPMKTSTLGTGQLLLKAVSLGAKKIYMGIGGSATVDGGMGLLEAVGIQFFDDSGNPLAGKGENLQKIRKVNDSNLLLPEDLEISIICDVENPLLGPNGAAAVFGPQKGATPEMVKELEAGLANFAGITSGITGRSVEALKGGGAAGGIAAGMVGWLNASIVAGAEFVLEQLSFESHVKWADAVITGEGKFDSQTLWNKAPFAVAQCAKKHGKILIGIAGSVENTGQDIFDGIFPIIRQPCTVEEAILNAEKLTYDTAKELARLILRLMNEK